MKLLTYILLAVSASAVVVDPPAQGRRVADRNLEQQVEAPKTRNIAFEIRHANERRKSNGTAKAVDARKAKNGTAKAVEARKAKNGTTKFITVRKSSNATARARPIRLA